MRFLKDHWAWVVIPVVIFAVAAIAIIVLSSGRWISTRTRRGYRRSLAQGACPRDLIAKGHG